MIRTITTIALLTATLIAPTTTAHAAWIHDGQGHTRQPFAYWAAASHMPAPNAQVEVHTEREHLTFDQAGKPVDEVQYLCPIAPSGVMFPACAQPWRDHWTVRMYSELGNWRAPGQRRSVFLHELGHVFDGTTMSAEARARFQRIDRTTGPWTDASNLRPPNERFAEAYKTCAFYGPELPKRYTVPQEYGYHPAAWQHRATCALITRVAAGAPT